ncbi:MAG TPA: glucose-6-phosphate dehydrogenase [bacterium]|nr:glucose-6-phosphate dehydrogenase [bacterium]
MRFIQTDSPEAVQDAIIEPIGDSLRGHRPALLLVSGGSTAGIAIAAIRRLCSLSGAKGFDMRGLLSVSLIDERFGPVGHQHSNWRQLLEAGLPVESVRAIPLLMDARDDQEAFRTTVRRFDDILADAARKKTNGELLIVGLLGIGADGHTAGILPGSQACAEDRHSSVAPLAIGYRSDMYTRITITPAFFQYFDRAVAYATGAEKWQAIAGLRAARPICEHPAQLLKRAHESLVFCDHLPGQVWEAYRIRRTGDCMEKLGSTVLVIFGITGDLSRRKLLPVLLHLAVAGMLPEEFHIVGISRKGTTTADIIGFIRQATALEAVASDEMYSRMSSMITMIDMNMSEPAEYTRLADELDRLDRAAGHPLHRMVYLAIPATLFDTVTARLAEADMNAHRKGARACHLLIEKPFGYNLKSAEALIRGLAERYDESQIYRIDHYLAKETAQNILAFRFENPLFSHTWNRDHISHIMITAVESIGIEGRAVFYENMGAMRDLVQSHLLQLLALVTMNQPDSMSSEAIHREKERILRHIVPPSPERMEHDAIRGQYATYRAETGNPLSMTETYAAVRLSIDTDEWRGVPVFIRTGKALRDKITEITLVFSNADSPGKRNYLTIRIQPNEGIVIDLHIKKPGFDHAIEQVQLDFCYTDKLSIGHPDAYERVLVDAMRGDRTLFASNDEVLSCWRISEPILVAWANPDFPLHQYGNNTWGPEAADAMIADVGLEWLSDTHTVCSIPRIIPIA